MRHDAIAVVLILDKVMGDAGGVNAGYAHLDGIEDVRNQMSNYKEKRCRNAHTKRGIAIGPEVGLGQILVSCCGGTTSPHGHTPFQFGRAVFQNC